MTRDEIEGFPNAVYFPGDDPPVGQRVRLSGNRVGVVKGRYRTEPRLMHACPSCVCPTPTDGFEKDGWWLIAIEGWSMHDDGCGYADSAGRPMVLVEYPPGLAPLVTP